MYREKTGKPALIHNLHPLSVLSFTGIIFLMSMVYTHPLYLAVLFIAVFLSALSASAWRSWRAYLTAAFFMGAFIISINGLVSPYGGTAAFKVPPVLIFAGKTVTWESLLFGANMALKLAVAFSVFSLYEAMTDPDRSLQFFTKFAPKSAVTAVLTSLLIPRLKRDMGNIILAMRSRGGRVPGRGSLITRLRALLPLWKVMLISSLEGAWDTAESMHARSFGTGKRSDYSADTWLGRDRIVIILSLLALIIFLSSILGGKGRYDFYPTPDRIDFAGHMFFVFALLACLTGLPLLNILWKKWDYLRSRI